MFRARVETGVSSVGEARPHQKRKSAEVTTRPILHTIRKNILTTVGIKYCGFLIPSRKTQLYLTSVEKTQINMLTGKQLTDTRVVT